MNVHAASASRVPTYQDGTSFVSAQSAVHVQTIADAKLTAHFFRNVLRFGVNETPNLIRLNALAGQIAERRDPDTRNTRCQRPLTT